MRKSAFQIAGIMSVKISKSQTDISASMLKQKFDDVEIVFEQLEIHTGSSFSSLNEVQIHGHVTKSRSQIGEFSVEKTNGQNSGEFSLNLDLH